MAPNLPPSPPAHFMPSHAPGHVPPFNDVTDNNPCGKPIVASVNGVDVSAQNLCLFHYGMKVGLDSIKGAVVHGA